MNSDLGFEVLNFKKFEDERGYFQEWFQNINLPFTPVQGNKSVSRKNTIRGIHLSKPGINQQKLITCVTGSIIDVVVNLRIGDKNFGKYYVTELSCHMSKSIFVGSGMGHAFMSLEEDSTVIYLTDLNYSPENEIAVNVLDPKIGIPWNIANPIISEKDLKAMSLNDFGLKYSSH